MPAQLRGNPTLRISCPAQGCVQGGFSSQPSSAAPEVQEGPNVLCPEPRQVLAAGPWFIHHLSTSSLITSAQPSQHLSRLRSHKRPWCDPSDKHRACQSCGTTQSHQVPRVRCVSDVARSIHRYFSPSVQGGSSQGGLREGSGSH